MLWTLTRPSDRVRPDAATVRRVLAEVGAAHGVTPACILGPERSLRVVPARVEALFAIYRAGAGRYSSKGLAGVMGLDHTTVIYWLRGGTLDMPWRYGAPPLAFDVAAYFRLQREIGRRARAKGLRRTQSQQPLRPPSPSRPAGGGWGGLLSSHHASEMRPTP